MIDKYGAINVILAWAGFILFVILILMCMYDIMGFIGRRFFTPKSDVPNQVINQMYVDELHHHPTSEYGATNEAREKRRPS